MSLPVPVVTIGLLTASNIFMTFAWYGHLRFKAAPLLVVVLVSWGIAFSNICCRCRRTASAMGISTPPS